MFTFSFVYSDGGSYVVQDVNKIVIQTASGSMEVVGDDILTARLPLKSMCLYSNGGNVSVSGTNLMVIDVSKQS